jgi:hypothetical protein
LVDFLNPLQLTFHVGDIITCLATGTPFGLLIDFINNLQVVTTINYHTVTHLQSLHANIFTLSAVVFMYSVSLNHTLHRKPSIHTLHLHRQAWLPTDLNVAAFH